MNLAQSEIEAVTALQAVMRTLDDYMTSPMSSDVAMARLDDLVESHGAAIVALSALFITASAVEGVANYVGATREQLWAGMRPQLDERLGDRAAVARLFVED